MSSTELLILAGFTTGFVGSVHCAVMCGGLVGVISRSMKGSGASALKYWTGYHFGRILSYTAAGFLGAGAMQQIAGIVTGQVSEQVLPIGTMIAGLFMVILGGHVAKWWGILNLLEQSAGRLWNKVVPVFSKLLPPKALHHSVIGGMLWGWIPCGLVYSALALAVTSADAVAGAIIMLSFGFGTLPMLLAVGGLSHRLQNLKYPSWIRTVSGGVICIFGVFLLLGNVPVHLIIHSN